MLRAINVRNGNFIALLERPICDEVKFRRSIAEGRASGWHARMGSLDGTASNEVIRRKKGHIHMLKQDIGHFQPALKSRMVSLSFRHLLAVLWAGATSPNISDIQARPSVAIIPCHCDHRQSRHHKHCRPSCPITWHIAPPSRIAPIQEAQMRTPG